MTVDASPTQAQVIGALSPLAPEDRLARLLDLLKDAPPDIFWPLFLEWFPLCDNIWPDQRPLRLRLRRAGCAYPYQSETEQRLLDDLDAEQQVFRGCNTKHRKGLSWSLSYERADGHARRHSAISRAGNVYETMIPKRNVFAAITSRSETFVLLDYECLPAIEFIQDKPSVGTDIHFADALAPWRDADGLKPKRTAFDDLMGATRNNRLPPLAFMSDAQLENMLEHDKARLRLEWAKGQIAWWAYVIQKTQAEIAERKSGARRARREIEGHKRRKKQSPGRPTNASRQVPLRRSEPPKKRAA